MTSLKNRTVADILSKLTEKERVEWLEKDAESFANSCEIEGLPINKARLLKKLKNKEHGV